MARTVRNLEQLQFCSPVLWSDLGIEVAAVNQEPLGNLKTLLLLLLLLLQDVIILRIGVCGKEDVLVGAVHQTMLLLQLPVNPTIKFRWMAIVAEAALVNKLPIVATSTSTWLPLVPDQLPAPPPRLPLHRLVAAALAARPA